MTRNRLVFLLAGLLVMLIPWTAQADTVFGSFTFALTPSGQAIITRYTGKEKNPEMPWHIQGHMVVEIGSEAFAGNNAVETVKLPVGVSIIRENAFRDCSSLKSVDLPSRLATIEDGAFLGCVKLMELEIPDSVAELGEKCFESWTKLTGSEESIAGLYAKAAGLNYGETVQVPPEPVDESAYYQYEIRNGSAVITSYLGEDSEVMIPSSLGGYPVRVIGENAFSSRYSVEKVVVPEGVTELDRVAFRYCPGLIEIQLPSSLRKIGDNAFYRCEGLEEIVIPEGVTELGDRAFRGCTMLRKVTLPRSLKTIPWYAFFECHERLIIYAPSGSAAEIYAGRKGYSFVSTGK